MSIVASILLEPWGVLGTVVRVVLHWMWKGLPELGFSVVLGYVAVRMRRRAARRVSPAVIPHSSISKETVETRCWMARNVSPQTYPDFVLWLACDRSLEVRRILASSPSIEFFPDAVMALAHSGPGCMIRETLAKNRGVRANPAAVERLLWDSCTAVRKAIASNPVLKEDPGVRERVAMLMESKRREGASPSLPYERICWFPLDRSQHGFWDELLLYRIPQGRVLRHVPRWVLHVIDELAETPENVWRALASCPSLPPTMAEFLAWRARKDDHVWRNLAENHSLPIYLQERLVPGVLDEASVGSPVSVYSPGAAPSSRWPTLP